MTYSVVKLLKSIPLHIALKLSRFVKESLCVYVSICVLLTIGSNKSIRFFTLRITWHNWVGKSCFLWLIWKLSFIILTYTQIISNIFLLQLRMVSLSFWNCFLVSVSSPAEFEKHLTDLLQILIRQNKVLYIDDILIPWPESIKGNLWLIGILCDRFCYSLSSINTNLTTRNVNFEDHD